MRVSRVATLPVLGWLVATASPAAECIDYTEHLHFITSTFEDDGGRELVLRGNYAFGASGTDGLAIFDVSDPADPRLVRHAYTGGEDAVAIDVDGDMAWIAASYAGLVLFDISDPEWPSLVHWTNDYGYMVDVVTHGDAVYVVRSQTDVMVFDTRWLPGALIHWGMLDMPGRPTRVLVNGDLLYVAAETHVNLYDVSFEFEPILLASIETTTTAHDVVVDGDHLYVVEVGMLEIFDVSDPSVPISVTTIEPFWGTHLRIQEGRMYASGPGLAVHDLSDPLAPVLIGDLDLWARMEDVQVRDGVAYLYGFGLATVDVSSPTSPPVSAAFDTPGDAVQIVVQDQLGYVADAEAGLTILDVSDPTAPVIVGSFPTAEPAVAVAVNGATAFVWDATPDLYVVDVSDPTAPAMVTTVPTYAQDLATAGDRLYISNGFGLEIYDVSIPSRPTRIGSFATTGPAWETEPVGSLAYVAEGWAGLRILDVSDASAIAEVGWVDTWADGVAVAGDRAYVAGGVEGFKVVDVSNPFAPELLHVSSTPGATQGLAADLANGLVYALEHDSGAIVFDVTSDSSPIFLGSSPRLQRQRPGLWIDTPVLVGDVVLVARELLYALPRQCPTIVGTGMTAPLPGFRLGRPVPLPASTSVSIPLVDAGVRTLRVEIFDVAGRAVRSLVEPTTAVRPAALTWDARGDDGRVVPPGVYYVKASAVVDRRAVTSVRRVVVAR